MNVIRAVLAALIAMFSASGAQAQTDAPAVALKGYDVVSYFTESRASKGSSEFRHDWDGARYYFSSAKHKTAFVDDPDRYTPQFRSFCAVGIGAGKRVEADPTAWKIVDGRLYVFSSHKAAGEVEKDPDILARSRQAWQTMK
jgi:YHS domain-containing protein